MRCGEAVRGRVIPAPWARTRAALSAWSRPCGRSTTGRGAGAGEFESLAGQYELAVGQLSLILIVGQAFQPEIRAERIQPGQQFLIPAALHHGADHPVA